MKLEDNQFVYAIPSGEIHFDTPMILVKCIKEMSDINIGEFQYMCRMFVCLEYWEPHHLYILSNDEINGKGFRIDLHRQTVGFIDSDTYYNLPENKNKFKKIIASTNSNLKLPLITEDFIKDFIERNKHEFINGIFINKMGKLVIMRNYNYIHGNNKKISALYEKEITAVTSVAGESYFVM